MKLNEVDSPFRRAVWNIFHANLERQSDSFGQSKPPHLKVGLLLNRLGFRKNWIVDDLPTDDHRQIEFLKKWILEKAQWYEVYELIEDAPSLANARESVSNAWPELWNRHLERVGSPYRFIDKSLAPITSTEEMVNIARAASHPAPYDAAAEHIATAIEYFGKRPNPDFENSIKESASAMESAICVAAGVTPGNFTAACTKFREKYDVHPALMESAKKLFGYANDEQGVRHAATDAESAVDFEEAQLVLVQASSWVNYVVQFAKS